jgi:hypothetical protein
MATTLTREQLLPFLIALEHRTRQKKRGQRAILAPLPACLECGQHPTDMNVRANEGLRLDTVDILLSCNHVYRLPGQILDELNELDTVNRIVDAEENRPAGSRTDAPKQRPTAAIIEIIERGADGTDRQGVIVPNEVRLNGVPLMASAEDPVIVHEISTRADELVRVTLTLFARRVSIRAEHDTT